MRFMNTIQLSLSVESFERSKVKISEHSKNAFRLNENGVITFKSNHSAGNARNTPGNGFDGELNQPMPIIRLNSTVSRKESDDPSPSNEGMNIPDFVTGLLNALNGG